MDTFDSPTPSAIKVARDAVRLTQTAAAEVVFTSLRAWQQWEYGERSMHLAFWHLFLYKTSQQTRPPVAQLSEPPLSPQERAEYAANLVQRRASFALEGMHPDFDDEVIQASILAGLVSPKQYQREMLAYVDEHKTLRGFLQTRPWAMPIAHPPELMAA
jgi:putative transcriptional regulator